MKTIAKYSVAIACVMLAGLARAQEAPEMPTPAEEHGKLAQFAGEWKVRSEATMPGSDEPMVIEGTDSSKMLGGFWLQSEGNCEMMGSPMSSVLTLGYDKKAKHYVGTFVCSAGDYMWEYTGQFDETGKKLVLETEGPSMTDMTTMAKYRETLETVDADHRKFTSEMQGDDGAWATIITMEYERVK